MKAKPVDKKISNIYKLGYCDGINYVANTIIKLLKGSNEKDIKTNVNTIIEFCKNSIKINEDIEKESINNG